MSAFMPANTIAGRILIKPGYERDAVFHAAAALLDTEHVRFVMMISNGHAWYIAAPASDFANNPSATAPLAAALPGHALHKGDGAYTYQIAAGHFLVVVKRADALKTYCGTEQQVRRYIELEGCTGVYAVTDRGLSWQSFLAEQRRAATALSRSIVAVGSVVVVVSALAWLVAAYLAGQSDRAIQELLASHRQELSRSVNDLNAKPQGYAAMREHGRLASEVLRYPNAQIKRFQYEDGRISWQVYVPANAELEKFRQLGANVDPVPMDGNRVAIERRVNL